MIRSRMMLVAAALMVVPVAVQAAGVDAAQYVEKAGASDLYEVEASKLVAKSSNPAIVGFSQMMIKDHTMASKLVQDAALADGLTLKPVALAKEQAAAIQSLAQAKGAERDKLYISQQGAAHQAALQLHTEYSANGDKPNLKAAAAKIAPIVQQHIVAHSRLAKQQ